MKTKLQVLKLECLIDPMDTSVTARDVVTAIEGAGAKDAKLTGTAMRLVVVPEVGGES